MTAMGSFSIWHWMLFGAVALLLFGGKGKISDLMGDVAKGVKSFKKGLADDDEAAYARPGRAAHDREPRRRRRQRRSQGRLSAFSKRSACEGGRWPRRFGRRSAEPCSTSTSAR